MLPWSNSLSLLLLLIVSMGFCTWRPSLYRMVCKVDTTTRRTLSLVPRVCPIWQPTHKLLCPMVNFNTNMPILRYPFQNRMLTCNWVCRMYIIVYTCRYNVYIHTYINIFIYIIIYIFIIIYSFIYLSVYLCMYLFMQLLMYLVLFVQTKYIWV
jgi:hypothetical protein